MSSQRATKDCAFLYQFVRQKWTKTDTERKFDAERKIAWGKEEPGPNFCFFVIIIGNMVEDDREHALMDSSKLKEISKCPRKLALLRVTKLESHAEGLAGEIVDALKTRVDAFLALLRAKGDLAHDIISKADETILLRCRLEIYLDLTQTDCTLAEELARQGSHHQLLRLISLPNNDETDDTITELQDMACQIGAEDPKFPQKASPFTKSELRSRLPLVFQISSEQEPVLIQQVTSRQSAQADVGFVMWPASVVLARWLVDNGSILKAKRILELGSGCGLVGIFAAMIRKRQQQQSPIDDADPVILTDFNPTVLDNLTKNAHLNEVECTVKGLDFYHQSGTSKNGGWLDIDGCRQQPVDLVLAADIICQKSDTYAAANSIKDALLSGGQAIVVSAKAGQRFGVEHFFGACTDLGLEVRQESVQKDTEEMNLTSGYFPGMSLSLFVIAKR